MKSERRPFTTTLYIWHGVSAMFFSNCVTPAHSHDTLQLLFDLGGQFNFKVQDMPWKSYKTLIINEHVIHQLDTNGSVQLIVYLDASSKAALSIQEKYLKTNEIFSLDLDIQHFSRPGELEKGLLESNKQTLLEVINRLLAELIGSPSAAKPDNRVSAVLRCIADSTLDKLTISFLADKVFLSESRLRALFRESMGVSLHRYIIWHKIRSASTMIMNGSTIVEAAEQSGFVDSSHFHKTMVQMVGVSPSQFIKENRRVVIEICESSPLCMKTKQYEADDWNVPKLITRLG